MATDPFPPMITVTPCVLLFVVWSRLFTKLSLVVAQGQKGQVPSENREKLTDNGLQC